MSEEKLYEQMISLIQEMPDWRIKISCCSLFSRLGSTAPDHYRFMSDEIVFHYAAPFPQETSLASELDLNDGIGPLPVELKVIKRLHEEGQAFHDLIDRIVSLINDEGVNNSWPLSKIRALGRLFPQIIPVTREKLRGEVCIEAM